MQISVYVCFYRVVKTEKIQVKYFFITFFVSRSKAWGNFRMNVKQNDQTPSDNPIESEAFDRLHAKKDGYNINDRDHDFQSTSTQESQQQMSHSFPWSLRNVVMLASLCVVVVLTFAALSMIAPFYPREVS